MFSKIIGFIKKVICGIIDVIAFILALIGNGIKKFFGFVVGVLK